MMQTHIYIAVDSISPRKSLKSYAYILECVVSGEPMTKDGYGVIEGSYHSAVLEAITEAMQRFKAKCVVTIHAEDEFVLNMIMLNLERWAENGFLTAKGKPVANQEQWIRIWDASKNFILQIDTGKHEYLEWMQTELERRKK